VFDNDRYFDVFVEYAKASPEDRLISISVCNRGSTAASLHVLPTLWFRNTWSWSKTPPPKPAMTQQDAQSVAASHHDLGVRSLYCDRAAPWLFTENETNTERLFNVPNRSPYVKDGNDNYIVHGRAAAVNPEKTGTKVAAHYDLTIPAGGVQVLRLRLSDQRLSVPQDAFGPEFDAAIDTRRREADEFYAAILPSHASEDTRLVLRQAYAGMLWSKQFYFYPVLDWIEEEILPPDCPRRVAARNREWFHLDSADILSMPDKWEYPWFAAWDLAFHCVVLAGIDLDFAKNQLRLMTNQFYLHPSGQIPAYEWNFSDVNPPVHCKATWQIYVLEKAIRGKGDRFFLETMFHKLLMNFTWWVNRKDAFGNNVFEGGFLGLDNIGVFDRSAALPTGGTLEQADGTSWMAMFCLDMLTIALELSLDNRAYEELACKFYEHFIHIAGTMDRIGANKDELWDEEDGFYYDVLLLPGGDARRIKVRSMVGLIPLFASALFTDDVTDQLPILKERAAYFAEQNAGLIANINDPDKPGVGAATCCRPSPARSSSVSCAECSTNQSFSARMACARCLGTTKIIRTPSRWTGTSSASTMSRLSPPRTCSAAIRIGAARSGCRSMPCSCIRSGNCIPTSVTTSPSNVR
jgi:hypothetical protein